MLKRYWLFILMVILAFSCARCGLKPFKAKIQFIPWHEAVIESRARYVSENSIAGFRKGVFTSTYSLEDLKNGYIGQGYSHVPEAAVYDKIKLEKENVKILLIYVDKDSTNILVDIRPDTGGN